MPRVIIKAGDFSGVASAAGFSNYDGPTPPKGLYRCKTGLFRIVENSSGDSMFKIVFEVNEPKGSAKAQYNGYAIWHNANLTEKSAPFANAMLDALGLSKTAVWKNEGGGIVSKKDKPEDVLKIGGKAVAGIEVLVTTKRENYPIGSDEWKLAASSFAKFDAEAAAAKDADAGDEDDDSDDDTASDEGDDDDGDDDSF